MNNWPLKPYQIWALIDHLNEYDRLADEAYRAGDCAKLKGWQANAQICIDSLIAPGALRLA